MNIPKKNQKHLLRLISARADVDYATSAFRCFQKCTDASSKYQTLLSMVVAYCRPFTENSGLGSLLCEYPDYPNLSLVDAAIRHQRMMDLRNKFLSHSSIEGTKVVLLAPGSIDPGTGMMVQNYSYNIAKREFLHDEFAGWLFELVEALSAQLDASITTAIGEVSPRLIKDGETLYLDTPADEFKWTETKKAQQGVTPNA